MKMVKSLLLGSAAGLVAIAGAQAADLPVKAKPVEYVKVCSLYGVGFFYIPGTDTCIKIGGYVRAEVNYNSGGSFTPYQSGANARDNNEVTDTTMRARFLFSTDTRTQTEYGTLRSYTRTGFTTTSGGPAEVNIGSTGALGTSLQVYIDRAFVQFAGFTAGRAQSFFDSYILGLHSNQTNIMGSENAGNGTHMFAYTAQLGNGLSATLGVEDATWRRKPLVDLNNVTAATGGLISLGSSAALSDYAGHRIPDIVGNIRLDQAWGYAQVSGAAHEIRSLYYTGTAATCGGLAANLNTEFCGGPGDEWGWAFGAGFVLNLPFAKGDTFGASFSWTEGALGYVAGNQANQFTVYSGIGSVGLGALTDGVFVNGGDIIKTEAWAVIGGIEHYWTPSLRSSLYGGYISVEYDAAAKTAICNLTPAQIFANAGASAGAGYTCDPDLKFWQIGSRTVWNPVANLDISVDVIYNSLDSAFAGVLNTGTAVGAKPASAYLIDDQDWWQFMFRVQRNFWL